MVKEQFSQKRLIPWEKQTEDKPGLIPVDELSDLIMEMITYGGGAWGLTGGPRRARGTTTRLMGTLTNLIKHKPAYYSHPKDSQPAYILPLFWDLVDRNPNFGHMVEAGGLFFSQDTKISNRMYNLLGSVATILLNRPTPQNDQSN